MRKIYIGGLPDSTRYEDLEDCFGQLGEVINIELKKGYGFVVSLSIFLLSCLSPVL